MTRIIASACLLLAVGCQDKGPAEPAQQAQQNDDFQAVLNQLGQNTAARPNTAPPLPAGSTAEDMPAGHPSVGSQGGAMPSGHPPMDGGATPTPEGPLVAGTVSVGESIKAPEVGSLFVMARPAEAGHSGPPYFVQKIDSANFPQSFELTLADAMMTGMPAPQSMHVQIRLDQDGDAISRTVGDVVGQTVKPVTIGAKNVKVVLTDVITQEKPTRAVEVPVQ